MLEEESEILETESEIEEPDDLNDPDWDPLTLGCASTRAPSKKLTSAESILYVMGAASSPAARTTFISTLEGSPINANRVINHIPSSQCAFSTPHKGPYTSHVTTPIGESKLRPSRMIECDDGVVTIFISEDKTEENTLSLLPPNDWVKNCIPLSDSLDGIIDFEITRENVFSGGSIRAKSQNAVMGNLSARDALINAGYEMPPRLANWIHFIPHAFLGILGQIASNMGLGLKNPNGAMEIINRAIPKILLHPNGPEKLYLSAIPKWVEGYENIRLLESITYIVKNAPGELCTKWMRTTFEMLSLASVCVTEIPIIEALMEKKFLLKPTPALVSDKGSISDEEFERLLSPSSPLIFSSEEPSLSEEASSSKKASSGSATPLSENSNRNTVPSASTVKLKPTSLKF